MKFIISHLKQIPFVGLLGLALVITTCNQLTAPKGVSATSLGNASYATFTYENVDFKIVSLTQQNNFNFDRTTSSSFVLRLVTKESSKADRDVYIFYSDVFHLILPDSHSVPASAEETSSAISQNVVRDNWVDFPLSNEQDLDKLVLRVGAADEHQMDIPLTENPNLSRYQPKTITPENKFQYSGVDWTITKVTASLSANGKQADVGMRYIAVELSAYNSGSSPFYPQPDNNIRLKSQDALQNPTVSTLPLAIVAASKGTTGVVYFLMPEPDTQLTLDFLAQPYSHIPEASTSFQVPV